MFLVISVSSSRISSKKRYVLIEKKRLTCSILPYPVDFKEIKRISEAHAAEDVKTNDI